MEEVAIEHFLYVEDLEMLLYLTLILSIIIFIYGLYRGFRRWTLGKERLPTNNIRSRMVNLVKYGLLQRKVLFRLYEGSMHSMIYIGFIILFIGTLLRALEYDIFIRLFGTRIIVSHSFLIYKFILNVGGIVAVIGLLMSLVKRLFFKSKYMPNGVEDIVIPLLLLYILVTGFILDGISTWAYRKEWIGPYDPVGTLVASILNNYPWMVSIYRVIWITHMLVAILLLAYIPYTKLFHIIAGGLLNTFYAREYPPSAFRAIDDIDEIVDKGGIPGAGTLPDFTWKERMDYDACIKCARCTDNCPATLSGKVLSPMDLILGLRRVMDLEDYNSEIVPKYVDPEVLWSCVTCGACVYQCPLLIHHVETIIDMRRYLLGKGEDVPEEVLQVSYNIMRYGNPLGNDPMERERFVSELVGETGIEIAAEDKEYEYLYWMGCQSSYDPNTRTIAKSLIKLLLDAGVNVAILGKESCCGEPVRRLGDELLFKELVKSNGDMLLKYKFKYLLVNCPHGYNIFKHEYPLYGYNINVIHHTQLLSRLIEEGKVRLDKKSVGVVTYHDPCYLGRWNNIYDEPRKVLGNIMEDAFIELPRNREESFCCGGGGGHLYFEVKRGERISKIRMAEALSIGAKTVCVACPYCKIMLMGEAPDDVSVLDISEFIVDGV